MTLPEIDVLLIGHMIADIVPGGFSLGGTVAYGGATAHALGLRVGVVTSARADEPLLDELRAFAHVVNVPAAASSTFENIYTPDGRVQYWRSSAATLHAAHIPAAWRDVPLAHLGPLTDEVAPDVVTAFAAQTRVLVTPQGWMRRRDADDRVYFKPWFDAAVLTRADLLVFSVEDVRDVPEVMPKYIAAAGRVAVTDGDKGGVLHHGAGKKTRYEAVPVQATDPTGAGDIFAVSLLIFESRFNDLGMAARAAAYIAAQSTTRNGLASAPTAAEIRAAIAYARQ